MTAKDLVSFWKKSSRDDLDTAETLFKAKKYHHGLYFCQLAIEKLLKGLIFQKTNKHALPIHNLVKLAEQAGIELSEDKQSDFKEITSWNIQARYDSVKFAFYKKATKDFALSWYIKVKEMYTWIKNQY